MSCSCEIDLDFYFSSNTHQWDEHVKARKEHQCCQCYRVIKKGEKYEIYTIVSDGIWTSDKTCADCVSIRDALFCSGWSIGDLWNSISDHYSGSEPPNSGCMSLLTKPARDKLCDIIEDGWND